MISFSGDSLPKAPFQSDRRQKSSPLAVESYLRDNGKPLISSSVFGCDKSCFCECSLETMDLSSNIKDNRLSKPKNSTNALTVDDLVHLNHMAHIRDSRRNDDTCNKGESRNNVDICPDTSRLLGACSPHSSAKSNSSTDPLCMNMNMSGYPQKVDSESGKASPVFLDDSSSSASSSSSSTASSSRLPSRRLVDAQWNSSQHRSQSPMNMSSLSIPANGCAYPTTTFNCLDPSNNNSTPHSQTIMMNSMNDSSFTHCHVSTQPMYSTASAASITSTTPAVRSPSTDCSLPYPPPPPLHEPSELQPSNTTAAAAAAALLLLLSLLLLLRLFHQHPIRYHPSTNIHPLYHVILDPFSPRFPHPMQRFKMEGSWRTHSLIITLLT